jgi:transcriptional regulator with XRE-family HTH domain
MSSQVGSSAKPIAAHLAALMAEHDLRAEDVAAELHISYRTITRWLSGKTEPTPTLARALGERFSIDWRSLYVSPDADSERSAA